MKDLSFLYTEDDKFSRQVMTILFQHVLGFPNLTIWEDTTDFLERFRQLPKTPDVVLLDIQITPYSGYEVIKMLREQPDYAKLKVIAMTASVTVNDVQLLREATFNGLIGKPINQKTFPQDFQRILAGEEVWTI